MMQLGCSTILYGGYSLDVALAGIQRAGYAAIELAAIPGMADHLSADSDRVAYHAVRRQVADHGLVLESIGASTNLLDPERRARFVRLIRAAAVLGAPVITTSSGGISDDAESFRTVIATISELARIGASEGVRLSIKPHVRAAVYSTATALRLMEEVDSTWVGLTFDPSHLWRAQEMPEEALSPLGPFLAAARLRDAVSREAGGPGPVEQQIPGNGVLNLPAIIQGLVAARPDLPYGVLEIVGTKELPLETVQAIVQTSCERLQALFDGIPSGSV